MSAATVPMTRPVKVAAFDLDGTLVDTMRFAPRVYADTVRQLGGPQLSADDITRVWHMGSTDVVLGHFLNRSATKQDLDIYFIAFEMAFRNVQPFPGVVAMLEDLHCFGLALGVFTTATRQAATIMLEASGLSTRLDGLVAGDEVIRPKPHPEGLKRLCNALGTTSAAAVYTGDASVDLDCALAAGAVPIYAGWGQGEKPDPSPDRVAHTPSGVVDLIQALLA